MEGGRYRGGILQREAPLQARAPLGSPVTKRQAPSGAGLGVWGELEHLKPERCCEDNPKSGGRILGLGLRESDLCL